MNKTIFLLFTLLLLRADVSAQEEAKWQVYKSTHFLIYYKDAPEDFITRVSDRSEEYYNKIADELGFSRLDFWLWDDRAKIYIYNDARDYRVSTGQPGWSAGATLPRNKVIQTFVGAEHFLDTILPHEMSHIIFREFVGFNNPGIPLWLDEGVAAYQEKERYADANALLKKAQEENMLIGLVRLSQPSYSAAGGSVQLFYTESFSLVDFMIKHFGKESFVTFCQNLRDKKNFVGALYPAYQLSTLEELDEAWQKYIKNE